MNQPVFYVSQGAFQIILILAMIGLGAACLFLIIMFIKEFKSNSLW